MIGYEVKELNEKAEDRIINHLLAVGGVIILAFILIGGIPMWTMWHENQKEVSAYNNAKRSDRLNELRERSLLRAAKAKTQRLELMAKLQAKYPEQKIFVVDAEPGVDSNPTEKKK